MPKQQIGQIPSFSNEDSGGREGTEVKERVEATHSEEKETPEESSTLEKPADDESSEELSEETSEEEDVSEDTAEEESQPPEPTNSLQSQIKGLEEQRKTLLKEITNLRGERRTLREEKVKQIDKEIDDLKDIHPDDIKAVERIIKSKGFMSKKEVNKMLYDQTAEREKNRFLEDFPEFKPENDPNDENWNLLLSEMKDYKRPDDPHDTYKLMLKARKYISNQIQSSERGVKETKAKLKTASKGGGNAKRSSSPSGGKLSEEQKMLYRKGGWSEEEIAELDKE